MSALKRARILFDEYHSEHWTISSDRAKEIDPEEWTDSSYSRAATLLEKGEFLLERNTSGPLTGDLLANTDILVLIHPCESKWASTTSPTNTPMFDDGEIGCIVDFVRDGGGLLVISEHENDKYGNNLNTLLAPFGLEIQNAVLTDKENAIDLNKSWVALSPEPSSDQPPITHYVRKICYYRGGTCALREADGSRPTPLFLSGGAARPKRAVAAASSEVGRGRVVLFADSDLFGDDNIFDARFDHSQLWLNVFYWLGERVLTTPAETVSAAIDDRDGFTLLTESINRLRTMQDCCGAKSSTVDVAQLEDAISGVESAIGHLRQTFPHQAEYFRAFTEDLNRWRQAGFGKPNFEHSLSVLDVERVDNKEYVVVFPMYLQNASDEIKFDCFLMSVVWPSWLAAYERSRWNNSSFITGDIKRYSEGYDSDCVVFFPEMVAGHAKVPSKFGVIFRNREAARVQRVSLKAAEKLRLYASPQMWCFLNNPVLIQSAFAALDFIHDTTHQSGPLPRSLFKEKGRRPYWMHALEELRCDLGCWVGASDLYKSSGEVIGLYVCWSVLFDRMIRYPITGPRVKNYDGLAGQVLTNALFDGHAMIWQDGVLSFDWDAVDVAVRKLKDEIDQFERSAVKSQSLQNWSHAYDLIASYVSPNVSSAFKSSPLSDCVFDKTRGNFATVLDDEFPLSDFHSMLKKQIA
jgi:hypothetical protein